MLVALAGDQAFVTPRTKFDLDLDAIFARVEDNPLTKGMFFNRALALAGDELDELELIRAAGLDEPRYIPFRDYPWADFIRVCCAVSDAIYDGRHAAGLRHIGRTLYSEFADSLAGRMTFGLLRNNADRVVGLGPKAWNMSGTPGQMVGESMGDRHHRYHFVGYPSEIAETLAIGVVEGALVECDETPRLLFGRADPMNSVIDIRWGDP